MIKKRFGLVVAGGLLASLFSTTAFANTIASGTANITGEVDVSGCISGCSLAAGIYFFNGNDSVPQGFTAGSSSGPFTNLQNGDGTVNGGRLLNLLGAPVTGTLGTPIVQEATFNVGNGAGNEISFDLTAIFAGTGTNAACATNVIGAVCTPTGSPFTLTQNGGNGNGNVCSVACSVSYTLNLGGIMYTGLSTTGSDTASGIFTAQASTPGTLTSVLAAVLSSGGLVDQTFSASFTANAVPEPGTWVMILSGLGMVALSVRSRYAHKQ